MCATLGVQKLPNASLTLCVELRNCMLLQLVSREMRDTFFNVMLECAILYTKSSHALDAVAKPRKTSPAIAL